MTIDVLIHGRTITDGENLEEQIFNSVIQTSDKYTSNDLLKSLIGQTEVHSFNEKVPSINEIFISKVKGEGHE